MGLKSGSLDVPFGFCLGCWVLYGTYFHFQYARKEENVSCVGRAKLTLLIKNIYSLSLPRFEYDYVHHRNNHQSPPTTKQIFDNCQVDSLLLFKSRKTLYGRLGVGLDCAFGVWRLRFSFFFFFLHAFVSLRLLFMYCSMNNSCKL